MLGQMVDHVLSDSKKIVVNHTCRRQEATAFHFDVEAGVDCLRQIMEQNGPFDYIVNCIGILSSMINETDSQSVRRAIHLNARFPHDLSVLAGETGARVIHISTDGVFARNAGICLEDTPLDCHDIYGKTKSLGEVIAPCFLTFRCSIIGPNPMKKRGLMEWFLNQPQSTEVYGYTDQMWNGVTTLQFAKLCRKLIEEDLFDQVRLESPVHHFCPNEAVSKHELLQLFQGTFRPDVTVKPAKSRDAPIARILDTRYQSLRRLFGYGLPMLSGIKELSREMKGDVWLRNDLQ